MRQVIHAVCDPEAGEEFRREGTDLSRFWKEVVVEGEFVHPTSGDRIPIDRGRLEGWKQRFDAMRGEGITVPIPYGHRHLYDCEKHAGTVEAAEVRPRADGRWALWMLCDVPRPEDASRIGTTIKGVSVGINHDFQSTLPDGKLKHWGEVIDHLALTNAPVIHQTEGFVPVEDEAVPAARVAANRGARALPDGDLALSVAHLSREQPAEVRGETATQKTAGREDDDMKLPDVIAKVKPLADRLGLSIDDDADEIQILALLDALPGKLPKPVPAELPETVREKALRLELEAFRAEKRAGEVRAARAAADTLMQAGTITRRQHEILAELLTVGPARVTNLAVEGDGKTERLVEKDAAVGALLLEFAHAIPEGAVTGKRRIAQPREADRRAEAEDARDKETVARMVRRAGGNPETGTVGGTLTT